MSKYGLIRYPGSKAKLWQPIVNAMPDEISLMLWSDNCEWEYREPFFGSGAIGFRLLDIISPRSKVWLNDKDYWLVCLWKSVQDSARELVDLVMAFKPNTDSFFKFKADDGKKDLDPVVAGFQKLALHMMSVSGFGVMSGTCLGGKNQENAQYPIDCRWNKYRLREHIEARNAQFRRFGKRLNITCRDFGEVLRGSQERCFIYVDPPYVEKGGVLYKHSMSDQDHARLAKLLKASRSHWIASYDDHPLIRSLYSGCIMDEVEVRYSNATNAVKGRPKNKEIIIRPAPIDALHSVGGFAKK